MTENDKKNKELAERLGLHICSVGPTLLHCECGSKGQINVPDFTSDTGKVQLLRLMMEREDWDAFQIRINVVGKTKYGHIWIDYITDTTGKLRDACLEWLRGEK